MKTLLSRAARSLNDQTRTPACNAATNSQFIVCLISPMQGQLLEHKILSDFVYGLVRACNCLTKLSARKEANYLHYTLADKKPSPNTRAKFVVFAKALKGKQTHLSNEQAHPAMREIPVAKHPLPCKIPIIKIPTVDSSHGHRKSRQQPVGRNSSTPAGACGLAQRSQGRPRPAHPGPTT